MPLTHLSLFSGIGGIDLAAHWAGFRTIQFVEREPFCQRVLAKNFPNVPIHDDVTTFDATGLRGRVTLLSGGFPCQPFSLAGKQRGKEDDRFLWPQMLRIAAQCRPAWIVGENVPGLIALALDDCLTSLESLGYATRPFIVSVLGVDGDHERYRVFIVAKDLSNTNSQPVVQENPQTIPVGGERDAWAYASCGDRRARRTLLESRVGRTIDGVSRRMDKHHRDRLRALGNAVVPQQVYPILEAIAKEC